MAEKKEDHPVGPPQPARNTGGGGVLDHMDTRSNNLPLAWKNWLTKFKIYLKAFNLDKESEDRRVALLLHFLGPECLNIFYSFDVDVDKVRLQTLIEKFTEYFSPKANITILRHTLFNRKQLPNENLDTYITDLKNIALQCNFGNLQDDLLKDIFSWNLNDGNKYIKEKILQEAPSSLESAIKIAKALEMSRKDTEILTGLEANQSISAIQNRSHHQSQSVQSYRSHRSSSRGRPSRRASPEPHSSRHSSPQRFGNNKARRRGPISHGSSSRVPPPSGRNTQTDHTY
ncbi:hypothetical protein ACJJTC_015905 [Scirpophaga incertulas]